MLAIDVGNTHITCAVFEGAVIRQTFRLVTNACVERASFWSEIPDSIRSQMDEVVLASVRRDATDVIVRDLGRTGMLSVLQVQTDTPMGIVNRYQTNATLGIDRLINVAAAFHLYCRNDTPQIVIDMGTATTIDYLTGRGEYLGGAIAPGIASAYAGLRHKAPSLPEIEISAPEEVIGRSTYASLRSGIVCGHVAMVEEMVLMMGREQGSVPDVVITGGLANVVLSLVPPRYRFDPDLTLKGLRLICEINRH